MARARGKTLLLVVSSLWPRTFAQTLMIVAERFMNNARGEWKSMISRSESRRLQSVDPEASRHESPFGA